LPSKDSQVLETTKASKPLEKAEEVKVEKTAQLASIEGKSAAKKVVEGIESKNTVLSAAKRAIQAEIEHKN
jgi:hypothetical protein